MLDRDLGDGQFNTEIILAATRQQRVISEAIPFSPEYNILPERFGKGYFPHWGELRSTTSAEFFLLTERDLCDINIVFAQLPSRLIEFYLNQELRSDQVRILDAGGGRDGMTARGVAEKYPSAQVVSVDLVTTAEVDNNFISIKGDICNLELTEETVDFAYSHQVLPFMMGGRYFTKQMQAVEGITKALRPGGAGVIDWTNQPAISQYTISEIESFGVQVMPRRKSYGGVFLFIAKNPIDSNVMDISTRAPSLAV